MESFKLTRTMSAMLFAIIAVISDVVRFMSILLLWTIGFAFIIYWLMVSQSVELGATLDEALHADIGDGHDDPSAIVYFQLLSYIKLTIITVRLFLILRFGRSAAGAHPITCGMWQVLSILSAFRNTQTHAKPRH